MQNYNNPQQPPPPGGYGAPPPPPAKKKMSTGVKVLIAAVALILVGGALLLVLVGVGGYYYARSRAKDVASTYPGTQRSGLSGTSSSSSSAGDDAEPPEPTAAQSAAIAGGQSAEWAQQEITWTVPQRWKKNTADSNSFMWQSPGSSDAAFLIVSISPMSADFPAETSIDAFHAAAEQRKRNGDVNEVKWLKLGGLKGVLFRESSPESSDSPQRLQWMGYRNYKGQVQLVNIMLSSQGKYFARHEDEMYGVLYSTQFSE
jgi:archaellin